MLQHNMRIKKLDDFKWIAAILVVANHTSPLDSINFTADFLLSRVLARIAVPFFLMVTGYFVLYAAMREDSGIRRILHAIKKTGFLYLAVTILYLPVQIYKIIKEPSTPAALLGNALRAIFFDGTYYHLWYLPAAIIGLLLTYLLLRYAKGAAFGISIVLYGIGMLGDSYYGLVEQIPFLKGIYEGMFRIFSYTRNGIFLAPIFLLLGYQLSVRKNERLESVNRSQALKALRNAIICLLFMCAEGILLHVYQMQRHDSMYLILPVLMGYLFWYLLLHDNKEKQKGRWQSFYLKGPMLLYFLHPFVILMVRAFVKVTKLNFILDISIVYFLAVLFGSLVAAYCCVWLGQRIPWFRKRRN